MTRSNAGAQPYEYDDELLPIVPTLPTLDLTDPVGARHAADEFGRNNNHPTDLSDLDVQDHDLDPAIGLRVRTFRPRSQPVRRGALLYIHGGGFVLGSIASEQANAADLARRLGVVVASVEYRLAPEHRYPAAIDDCTVALRWLHAQSSALGVDPTRVAVYGHSAGGALSAALALRARDQGGPPICFQFLGMPVLDDRLDTPSMRQFVDTVGWNRPSAALSWRHYLGDLAGDAPSDAAPARATDLRGLPPAYVSAMEFDPLRDEAIDYATRMIRCGVSVELHVYPRTFHGSMHVAATTTSRYAHEEELVVLRYALRLVD